MRRQRPRRAAGARLRSVAKGAAGRTLRFMSRAPVSVTRRTALRAAASLALAAGLERAARADDPPAPLEVVVSLPYLADIARAIGGEEVRVTALAAPGADPHALDPTPAHIDALRRAQVFVENGVQLEGWAARALATSGNAAIVSGQPGHVVGATGVSPLEVPTPAELAGGGHVHAAGNPHVWLDPLNLGVVARNVEVGLAAVRPTSASRFEQGRKAFDARLDAALFGSDLVATVGSSQLRQLHRSARLREFLRRTPFRGKPLLELAGGWLKASLDLADLKVITYHRTWTYAAAAFGLTVVATVEDRPGIPPTPAAVERLQGIARESGVKLVVSAPYEPTSRAESVAEGIGGLAIVLPTQPGEVALAADVFSMFDTILRLLADAQRRTRGP
jgi:zinc/manganese transport system substrate-binding protein